MVYEIWDTKHAMLVGSFDSEAEALSDVLDAVNRFGRAYAQHWALAVHDGKALRNVAQGEALIDRAAGQAVVLRE